MRKRFYIVFFVIILFGEAIVLKAQDFSKLSFGISAGGTGLAGVPVQFRPTKNLAFELGVYVRTAQVNVFYDHRYWGTGMDIGLNLYMLHKEKPVHQKLVSNGLFLKAGLGIWDLQESIATIGWVKEVRSLKHKKRFFQFLVGPSVRHRVETFYNTRYPPGYQKQIEKWYSGMLYARLTWFVSL
ncbi:hypothetical protein ACFLSI_03950 [Bacteroidota bacterium]